MKRLVAVTTVGVLALGGVVALVSTAGAAGSGGNAAPVVVTNAATSPVPVAGTVNVGNFPAAAPVTTALLLDTTLGGTAGSQTAAVDVSRFKTVRMYLGRVYGTGCDFGGTITVALRDTDTGSVIDAFTIGDVNHTNKVYEAPGTSLRLDVSGPTACIENIRFWGRSN
jgi:hypothetical protein